jgi:phosphoglycolate phosphatase-like HAD superfamily hydrolase
MQLAIFDLDGTLTKTTQVDEECFLRALAEELGIASIDTHWSAYTHVTDSGITLQIFQERLGRAPTADEESRLQRRFAALLAETFRARPEACVEVPGARAALTRLRALPDWALAIATGSWRASALLKLDTARIPYDDVPAAFADDGLARPAIITVALARSREAYEQSHFDRIVYIGDAVWDVKTAIELRMPFVGIRADGRTAVLRERGATHVLQDFGDFDRFVHVLTEADVPREFDARVKPRA